MFVINCLHNYAETASVKSAGGVGISGIPMRLCLRFHLLPGLLAMYLLLLLSLLLITQTLFVCKRLAETADTNIFIIKARAKLVDISTTCVLHPRFCVCESLCTASAT